MFARQRPCPLSSLDAITKQVILNHVTTRYRFPGEGILSVREGIASAETGLYNCLVRLAFMIVRLQATT